MEKPKMFRRTPDGVGKCPSCDDKMVGLVLHGRLDFIADDGESRYNYNRICRRCADEIEKEAKVEVLKAAEQGFVCPADYSDLF